MARLRGNSYSGWAIGRRQASSDQRLVSDTTEGGGGVLRDGSSDQLWRENVVFDNDTWVVPSRANWHGRQQVGTNDNTKPQRDREARRKKRRRSEVRPREADRAAWSTAGVGQRKRETERTQVTGGEEGTQIPKKRER
ncbi:hypothetical protein AJ80_00068 [Polytolypa hystricis UAMH7299]|uniref:Uncharacterized protein n=1 Tax=Polytolypa hystricis (strain UAMH7299) TaxID=1447883 RepID=A0A2B7Z4X1_POLH7|nr:hypothetical protein AJ80_00068 [Polytolypa hystricis UAMH7299]